MDCKVSIIVPYRNEERYIRKALYDISKQTHENIEVICVDDSSTDLSNYIVKEFCKKDERFIHIKGNGNGSGAARNLGLRYATGKYLCFLDSDDMFEHDMIYEAVKLSEDNDLDICIWNGCEYDNVTKEQRHNTSILFCELLPGEKVFSWKESKFIFNLTNGAPWNQLYRKSFFDHVGIRYMEQECYNDLFVTYGLMVNAHRIAVIEEEKIKYRVNNWKSLQGNKEISIENAFKAYEKLKKYLIDNKLYQGDIKNSFSNMVLSSLISILDSIKTYDAFASVYKYIQETTILSEDLKEENVFTQEIRNYLRYRNISNTDIAKYIFEIKTVVVPPPNYQYLLECEYRLNETRKSFTYKVGMFITYIPRTIRKKLQK